MYVKIYQEEKELISVAYVLVVESSWIAIRNDPALMLAYQKLVKRMLPQKAIIRISKKLTNRILYVLKNKKSYVQAVVK